MLRQRLLLRHLLRRGALLPDQQSQPAASFRFRRPTRSAQSIDNGTAVLRASIRTCCCVPTAAATPSAGGRGRYASAARMTAGRSAPAAASVPDICCVNSGDQLFACCNGGTDARVCYDTTCRRRLLHRQLTAAIPARSAIRTPTSASRAAGRGTGLLHRAGRTRRLRHRRVLPGCAELRRWARSCCPAIRGRRLRRPGDTCSASPMIRATCVDGLCLEGCGEKNAAFWMCRLCEPDPCGTLRDPGPRLLLHQRCLCRLLRRRAPKAPAAPAATCEEFNDFDNCLVGACIDFRLRARCRRCVCATSTAAIRSAATFPVRPPPAADRVWARAIHAPTNPALCCQPALPASIGDTTSTCELIIG